MQDIIEKIDQRVTTLLIFERHELIATNAAFAALLALHEDMALALRRIASWQQTLELWLQATGLSSLDKEQFPFPSKLIASNRRKLDRHNEND